VNLLRREIHSNRGQFPQNLINKRFAFLSLEHDEMTAAFLSYFDKGVAGHVLYTFMRLVHEFEELVDDCFQELPVSFEEARVLPHDIHDVGGDDGFVVLAAFHFDEA
jgi:hypothetical protein